MWPVPEEKIMSYTVEDVSGCKKKILFDFKELDLASEIRFALVQKQKKTNLKGFRKGKAPLEMVRKMYEEQIESDALNKFIQNKFYEAVTEGDLRVVGLPSIENVKYHPEDKTVSFSTIVELFPSFELEDISDLSFTRENVDVTEEDIDNVKKSYLDSKSEMVEVEDETTSLKDGLFAVMNFQGVTEKDERPENMKGEEYLLEIGSNQFIPGFEDGMKGMKKGEKKNIELVFPSEYHSPDLKDSKVVFEVELLEIKEKKLPELTEELAKEFNFESVDDFVTKTRKQLISQKENQSREKLKQEILEKLVEKNSFDIPETMLGQQKTSLKKDMEKNLKNQGLTEDKFDEYFEKWEDDISQRAEFQVRSGLILDKLARKYEIETGESDLEQKLEETSKNAGIPIDQVRKYYASDEKMKQNMMYALREEKTFDKLIEKLNIL